MTGTFDAAVVEYVAAAKVQIEATGSANNEACRVIAIGFLSRMEKGTMNETIRVAGGYTAEQWKIAKVALSRAWRAVGGEYGFGDVLAEQWAAGDYTVSLGEAYKASAPPKKVRDVMAECVKLLLTLSDEEREAVMAEVLTQSDTLDAFRTKRAEAFAKLFPAKIELVQDEAKVA